MGSIGDVVRGEGRLQLVLCCSSRNETKGQNLREQRGWGRGSVGSSPGFLASRRFPDAYSELLHSFNW